MKITKLLHFPQEAARVAGEIRVTLMPKRRVHSLMDLGANKGFEVRAHVLPPYQHRPGFLYKIRAGKPPKKSDEAAR